MYEKKKKTTTKTSSSSSFSFFTWWSLFFSGCGSSAISAKKKNKNRVVKQVSITRLSFSDFSNSTTPEDLSLSLVGSNLQIFTLAELKSVTRNFSTSNFVGEGGFGPVYKGFIEEKLRPGLKAQAVAVKLLDLDGLQGHKEWLAEVIFLGQLRHPHLVKLIGYCYEDEHRLLVYEFMNRGNLENHLFRRFAPPLSWKTRMKIAVGAAKGLAFLHEDEQQVIYRDFKPSNILLDSDYNAKLSDFGLATDGPLGEDSHISSSHVMGTEGYAAPEYIMTGHLTSKNDVYSFGVVLLELLTGRRSVDKNRPCREQNLVEWAKPYLTDSRRVCRVIDPRLNGNYSTVAAQITAELAHRCLSHNPKSRPPMSTVVETLDSIQELDVGTEETVIVYVAPPVADKDKVKVVATTPKDNNDKIANYNRHGRRARSLRLTSYSDTALHSNPPRRSRSIKGR